jgi:hypothetical protein
MNIITTQNFVAGIFAQWADAQHYLSLKPSEINGFVHTNTDLVYPFWLFEVGDGRFIGFQTEAEALRFWTDHTQEGVIGIIYTIYEDYQPDQPWIDFMGKLAHEHLVDDDGDPARAGRG